MQVRAERGMGAASNPAIDRSEIPILRCMEDLYHAWQFASNQPPFRKLEPVISWAAMKVTVRLLFVLLTVSLGSLTPIVPGQIVPSPQSKTNCCADMNAVAGQRCPLNPTGNSSTSGSTCCVSPSTCVPLCVNSGDGFAGPSETIGPVFVNNDRVSARSQRPPVPPPRSAFS